ncbi:MAG: TraB/GumN family protein, partial [Proteobacteria bacterium]|nr:TraB/GumN family protein [Pseudomonadota bacterium]
MFRPFSASFAALGLAFALPACAQPAATKDADPALWVVKDKDTTIYLFGTIHVLKPGLSWFDEAVKKAFDRSGTLVLEMVEPDQA